ncbi:MAG: hypothetical protein EPO26_04095 [Chloroflexota bacterium]|nr:MAG: hypothetical protein EPO26_04095 [Chloroflexota bacterium]
MSGLTIVSPTAGEGKTAITCALARALPRLFDSYVRIGSDASDATFVGSAIGLSGAGTRPLRECETLTQDRALVVAAYAGDRTAQIIATHVDGHRSSVVGAIVTGAPNGAAGNAALRAQFADRGLPLFGAIPETRSLRAATVAELAAFLGADVIAGADGLGAPVESFMVGAMSHVSGVPYFNRMTRKAVVCGGNRIDVQLAALGTPCQCIVATGGVTPDPVVLERAEVEGVPIVCVEAEAVETLDRVSAFLRATRFRHADKVEVIHALAARHLDLSAFAAAIAN